MGHEANFLSAHYTRTLLSYMYLHWKTYIGVFKDFNFSKIKNFLRSLRFLTSYMKKSKMVKKYLKFSRKIAFALATLDLSLSRQKLNKRIKVLARITMYVCRLTQWL